MPTSTLKLRPRLVSMIALLTTGQVFAAPALRQQVDQHGDFVMFGNTLGWDCNISTTNRVLTGTVSCTGVTNGGDSGSDVYWASDYASVGQATASTAVTMANARSTAMLVLPSGARVTYARLYWAGWQPSGGTADGNVTIERPSTTYTQAVTAERTWTAFANGTSGEIWYQGTADITTLVGAAGPGAFRVSGVTSASNLNSLSSEYNMAGWAVVVFYQRDVDPPRNLALFDGLDPVNTTTSQTATLSGFLVPTAGYRAKLGVIAYEGDSDYTGDQLSFNGTVLTDALNPSSNFFNSTHSDLGVGVSNVGDLPRLSGTAASMGGVDLDVVDITSLVHQGDTSATVTASTGTGATADRYVVGAFVTSISTFKPDFSSSGKAVRDINGGAVRPGDILEYTVTVTNTGNDTSIRTVMTDALPTQVTYVPGSIALLTPTAAPVTDAAGDDVGEYVAASRTVRVRLGTGATAALGGQMNIGDTITLRFQVTLNASASGTVNNQAVITAEGLLGAPTGDFPTDGNGSGTGVPPTPTVIDNCAADADCTAPTPYCDGALAPAICVACLTSAQCTNAAIPDCNPSTHVCECAAGPGNCVDTDHDGMSDGQETTIGTNPNDADSDDDGVPDGSELAPSTDTDGDGLINALDPDSDNDGLFDGTELGLGCSGAGTDLAARRCVPDADLGVTKTDPLTADTDGGGVRDGSEDSNLNGRLDAGETDPTPGHAADDVSVVDNDGDGLSDGLEIYLGSNPNDRDSDDDGVLDGQEPNPSDDIDLDGLIGLLDPDSDDDGLYDGTEMGFDCTNPATNTTFGVCRADADAGQSRTSPLHWDTDHGGVSDGSEDFNLDGRVDVGETNPVVGQGADDVTVVDTDHDGLSDGLETTLGSNPTDADSDDDGARDGEETNPSADSDGDGQKNVLDTDSDNDGLVDGTELGFPCSVARGTATNNPATCVADTDLGATWTSPVNADTDRGGVKDSDEDVNHNGQVDTNERNPNLTSDDHDCFIDAQCDASVTSGRVCNASHICVDGCRGTDGNGCPTGQVCSSTTSAIGTCSTPSGAGGASGTAGSSGNTQGGSTAAGGTINTDAGGTTSAGGTLATGGAEATGGDVGMGGTVATGGTTGTIATGGAEATGGDPGMGGTPATGGAMALGGTMATGGAPGSGGLVADGGVANVLGGASAVGGDNAAGGVVAFGGAAATGGAEQSNNAGAATVATGGTEVGQAGSIGSGGLLASGGDTGDSGGASPTGGTAIAEGGSSPDAATGGNAKRSQWNEGESLEGGGCACTTVGNRGNSVSFGLMLTLGLLLARRRRGRSSGR